MNRITTLTLLAAAVMLAGCSTLSPDPSGPPPWRTDVNFDGNRGGPPAVWIDGCIPPWFTPSPDAI